MTPWAPRQAQHPGMQPYLHLPEGVSPGVSRVSLVSLRHAIAAAGLCAAAKVLLGPVGRWRAVAQAAQIALLLHLPQDFQRSRAGSILHSTCTRQQNLLQYSSAFQATCLLLSSIPYTYLILPSLLNSGVLRLAV